MAESLTHHQLVEKIANYSLSIIPEEYRTLLKADLPEYEKPSLSYDSFIPDVMYKYANLLIIGEAKTYGDFLQTHSKLQYRSYINETNKFPGNSIIIVAIPWDLFITAKNHFRKLKLSTESKTRIIIITEHDIIGEV